MPLPYENATSGERALGDIQKLLRGFGCSKFGSMIDDGDGTALVEFEDGFRVVTSRYAVRKAQP